MTEEMTSHGLTLNRREKINATGITDVISFDEENIVAQNYNGSFDYKRINCILIL